MPNYDWQCEEGHTFEKFLPLSEWQDKMRIPCEKEGCSEDAHQVVLPRGTSTTLQPFVYYLNAQGEIRIPGSSNLPTPKGHTRCEATTLAEVRQLERKCAGSERSKIALSREIEDANDAGMRQLDRNDIKQYLSSNRVPEIDYEATDKTGEIVYTGRMKEMSAQARDMMLAAVERSNSKRDFKSHDPGYHFQVLHQDARTGKREYEG